MRLPSSLIPLFSLAACAHAAPVAPMPMIGPPGVVNGPGTSPLPPPPPVASFVVDDPVPATGCTDPAKVPRWGEMSRDGATIDEVGLRILAPGGWEFVETPDDAHVYTLTQPGVAGGASSSLKLFLLPVCSQRRVPAVQEEMMASVVRPLAEGEPVVRTGKASLGEGLVVAGEVDHGERTHALWFRWVEVMSSADFELVIAGACARVGDSLDAVCDEDLVWVVDSVHQRLRP